MTKYSKKIRKILIVISLVLSHLMCIHVAAGYTDTAWGNKMGLYSGGPPALSVIYAFPYIIGIVICMILSRVLRKKESQTQRTEQNINR